MDKTCFMNLTLESQTTGTLALLYIRVYRGFRNKFGLDEVREILSQRSFDEKLKPYLNFQETLQKLLNEGEYEKASRLRDFLNDYGKRVLD